MMPPGAGHKTFVTLLDQRINQYVQDALPLSGVIQPISIPYLVHGGDTPAAGTGTGGTTSSTAGTMTSQLLPLSVGPLPPFCIDFPFVITGVQLASVSGGAVTLDIGTAAIVPTTLPSGYVMSVFPRFFSITGAATTTVTSTDPTTGLTTASFVVSPGPNSPSLNGSLATVPEPYVPTTAGAARLPADWLVQWPAATWLQYSILVVDGLMTDLTIHLRVLKLGQSG
jgi:hypothetical protein